MARGINRVRGKASGQAGVAKEAAKEPDVSTDRFLLRAEDIKEKIKTANMPVMSPSPAPEALQKAFDHFGLTMATPSGATVRELWTARQKRSMLERFRKAHMANRMVRVVDFHHPRRSEGRLLEYAASPHGVQRQELLDPGHRCENTVAGTTILQAFTTVLGNQFGLQPKIEPENESYCFGPGEPVVSLERWFVPIGIRGAHSVICSSSIQDGTGSKISSWRVKIGWSSSTPASTWAGARWSSARWA